MFFKRDKQKQKVVDTGEEVLHDTLHSTLSNYAISEQSLEELSKQDLQLLSSIVHSSTDSDESQSPTLDNIINV